MQYPHKGEVPLKFFFKPKTLEKLRFYMLVFFLNLSDYFRGSDERKEVNFYVICRNFLNKMPLIVKEEEKEEATKQPALSLLNGTSRI